VPGDRDDAENGLDRERDEARDGEEEPDLGVREREVVANRRPRGLAGAEDQLVQELDRQQRRDDAAEGSTDQQLPGRVHRASLRSARLLRAVSDTEC